MLCSPSHPPPPPCPRPNRPGLDYWCRTFYTPLLVKTDGQALVAHVDAADEASLVVRFSLFPTAQFDQAGVMVLLDERTWCKAGIEFVDGWPRLACVVTNAGYSDWSTSRWSATGYEPRGSPLNTPAVHARLRITKLRPGAAQGGCLVIEAAEDRGAQEKEADIGWAQTRVASLRAPAGQPWRIGVYAQSPVAKRKGGDPPCSARFHSLHLGRKVEPVHEAALPEGHGGL